LQPDTPHLIRRLIDEDYEVHLETNGSLDIQPVPDQCRILMDIKCPGSGESDKNHMNNLLHLRPGIELKFVVSNKSDYEWARDFCEGRGLFAMNRTIHFSLVHGKLDPKKLTKWMLKDRVNARLHLQLHKVVWGPSGKEKG